MVPDRTILHLEKKNSGGEGADPDTLPFKNYGVHTIKPQLRPWSVLQMILDMFFLL